MQELSTYLCTTMPHCHSGEPESSTVASHSMSADELVEHVEECELDAAELLLKRLYTAEWELPEEAQGNGRLMLQVRPGGE